MYRFSILLVLAVMSRTLAFSTTFLGTTSLTARTTTRQSNALSMQVVDIDSEAAFDRAVSSAGSALVVVDYSTTWCGPCKVIAPKFDEMSDTYTEAVFLKVIGDSTPDASKLMKREGVRSVPSFHYFKDGEKVDVVNGANADAIVTAIKKHI
mmetsp:Transcript_5753/g.6693  ORF Transcript_5753/g.6693 Transcript_5753/m.6693 type:complete len:152 (-) Transcript_5753:200-655(-)|eukprot:CAMPEP_0198257486 /NCGR_PEP_ID=MMETSP1447-20131203/7158_1 /TAXON_ID=420782 /ORGANISM="Chaetoceros dichaeta, Strain CCMP1751" /LENGTH=151 /DNA_ID=CAMNT_0043944405 /DNA_START=228 /DNA_END=683 /DNA_ORIENTATION=+